MAPRLLFDEDLSPALVNDLADLYPGSAHDRLGAVILTQRGVELIRIISARRATPPERHKYEEDFR